MILRIYESVVKTHLSLNQQMVFLAGPRQVGKTTISKTIAKQINHFHYLSWDVKEFKQLIMQGPMAVGNTIQLNLLTDQKPVVIFDEIHKYKKWKNFIKGFYDLYKDQCKIVVTGSSRLDIYRRGGDSLMGRYFIYRIHPLSIAECVRPFFNLAQMQEIHMPIKITDDYFRTLWQYGGFPEPFIKDSSLFFNQWKRLRTDQLFKEDIRSLSQIHELDGIELLAELINNQAGELVNYSNFANKVNVAVTTIKRWINTLESFYYCFTIRPWHKNITRSLLKEPKIYLWDWSTIQDVGARAENFVASHLLKAIHFWTDCGLGDYKLYFIRDKEKNEVDFLVTRNKKPWFLVEVKYSETSINPALYRFHAQLNTLHAFQVVIDLPFIDADCFKSKEPIVVPAITFLSQLI